MIEIGTPAGIQIGSELEQLLQQVNEEKAKFDKLRPFDEETEQRIKMAFLPDRVTASLNMEGIIATRRQTLAIMDGMTVSENASRTEREILNALKADEHTFEAASDSATLNESLIRELHSLIEDEVGEAPGRYRGRKVEISQAAFTPPDHISVPAHMQSLVVAYNADVGTHSILRASWLHARFTHIHPFLDGNGRTGRLLQDFSLLQGNLFPTGIPSAQRDDYYDALANADNHEWDGLVRMLALRQLDVIAKASGIAQERKQRSTWIGAIARRAQDKKAGSQHKNFLVWSHRMGEIKAAFEDTAKELSQSSDLIQVTHDDFEPLTFSKWQEICKFGGASRTWSFAQNFYVDGVRVFRCIFYFRRHRHLLDDNFAETRDLVSLFVTGGETNEDYSFYRFEDPHIRLREILFFYEDMNVYYFDGIRLDNESNAERWSPVGPSSVSELVQDFYEDILSKKAGV